MSTERQKANKTPQTPTISTVATQMSPEVDGDGAQQAAATPYAMLTPTNAQTLQRTVGNQATISHLNLSSVNRQVVQCQGDSFKAVSKAINAVSTLDPPDQAVLLGILSNLMQIVAGVGTSVNVAGIEYTLLATDATGLITIGSDRLTTLLVETINTRPVDSLATILQAMGIDYTASNFFANNSVIGGITQVLLPGDQTLRLSLSNTESISAAADNKIQPELIAFADERRALQRSYARNMQQCLQEAQNQQEIDELRRTQMEGLHRFDLNRLNVLTPLAHLRINRWEISADAISVPGGAPPMVQESMRNATQDVLLAALQLNTIFNAEANMDADWSTLGEAIYGVGGPLEGMSNPEGFNRPAGTYDYWCGAFAMINYRGEFVDRELRNAFSSDSDVEHFFSYGEAKVNNWNRAKRYIFDVRAEQWKTIRDYHSERGYERRWSNISQDDPLPELEAFNPRSGDVVTAITDSGGHVAMVHSWDPTTQTLFLIDGNADGYRVATTKEEADQSQEDADEQRAEAISGRDLTREGWGHVGIQINNYPDGRRDLNLKFIGRPSLVDFEEHFYSGDEQALSSDPRTGESLPENPQ